MTPDQLEIIEAFKQVTFRPEHKKFVDALIATAKQAPGTVLNDKQGKAISDLAFKYRRQMPIGLVIKQTEQTRPAMEWMANDMVKAGSLKDEAWVADNARRAVALFPNKSLHTCACLLAALHPFAYDYLSAAPVLVLAIAQGSTLSKVAERKKVAREWVSRFEKGGKLRDIMAHCGLALQLRKLHPSILESNHWNTVQALCTIDPSTLAQIIPEREDQKEWLGSIGQWSAQMERRFGERGRFFEWACRQLAPANLRKLNQDVRDVLNNVGNIADFAGQANTEFNMLWTIERAMIETRRWHDQLARQGQEQRFFSDNAYGWEQSVDYTPFPQRAALDDFEFHALQTGAALFEEGREMHHCVGSYSRDVISGRSRIYSMVERETQRRVATVEFSNEKSQYLAVPPTRARHWQVGGELSATGKRLEMRTYQTQWHLVQAKGPCNAALSKDAKAALSEFEYRLNYYWAMFTYERQLHDGYQARLEQAMLRCEPFVIEPSEFPGRFNADMAAKIAQVQADVLAKRQAQAEEKAAVNQTLAAAQATYDLQEARL